VYQVSQLILYVSRTVLFRSDLDRHFIRAAMVFTFFAFSIQKWTQYTAEMLVPLISHSPVVFWLLPAFGVRGAGYFLGTTEMIFGEAGGFPIMTLPLGFLMKDVLFLAASLYLLKQDVARAALDIERS